MKAIVVRPPNEGVEVKDVTLSEPRDGKIVVRTRLSGLCGTDRGLVTGRLTFARPPPGYDFLILGHETLGEVVKGNGEFSPGDLVVPVVRRGCGSCLNCMLGRQDFCETGRFTEIGIRGAHGTMREEFLEDPKYLVKVPRELGDEGVLLEPLSNVVKALTEMEYLQRRSWWRCDDSTYSCRTAVVLGSGPIGLLFSMALRSMGFRVIVANKRPPSQVESEITRDIGATFLNTSEHEDLEPDLLVDTSGHPSAVVPLLPRIRKNGAVILFGTTGLERYELTAEEITTLVENNILIFGSVNASKADFQAGVNLLVEWKARYPGVLQKMITKRVSVEEAPQVLKEKVPGEIKTIIDWTARES
ncbi:MULTISPECIES: glucose 1-dehydrogenase [Metallosphaera]|uniref:glucose 1-dehydrogenase n=1 Tax=Metallosphaera TaxID=41980 RepID=UPI001F0689E7|nr:glucose 1-dehydrogenase [Metallosphaera sedula]MCH1770321.1 glucose 1-dehydrogenase [Metallosphaera sedula]MCP6727845.1 glucose 1-dehydrogenase [Metallosphaera sedula]